MVHAFVGPGAVLLGVALLVYGGTRTVDAAASLARGLGLPTLFVGVTVVSVGSSIPEIATSLYSGLYGAGDLAVGHVVGSATSQITLGVGLVGLLAPLELDRSEVGLYGGGMLVAMLAMLLVVRSGTVTRAEGALMAGGYLLFLAVRYRTGGYADLPGRRLDGDLPPARAAAWLAVGVALVVVGGHLLVTYGRAVAASLGAPTYLLGLLTGLGTTVPEIVIAVLAVRRGQGNIAVGTLFGSNITDPLFSLGVGALIDGFALSGARTPTLSAAYLLLVSTFVVGVFYTRERLARPIAAACVLLYLPAFLL